MRPLCSCSVSVSLRKASDLHRWGTKRVRANQVYQEFITDKHHTHMNSTRWVTLTEFVKYLGREGIVHADETEKGWFIAWIDNSPKALARQAAHQAKERSDMDDEQRMRKLIQEQIARAEKEKLERGEGGSGSSGDDEKEVKGLERGEGAAPITLSFGGFGKKDPSPPSVATKADPTTEAMSSTDVKPSTGISLAPKPNPLKINPLKRPAPSSNPLKANPLKSGASSSSAPTASKPKPAMSAMEAIIAEEEAKKRRRDMQTWSGRGGHGSEGLQVKRQKV